MREVLYGRQPVRETLRAGRRQVFKVLLARGVRPSGIVGQILTLAERAHTQVQEVDRGQLDSLGGEVNHQGLAAEVSGYPYVHLTALLERSREASEPPFLVLLDHLQDPQNVGSILRTVETVGAHGVVIPTRRAAAVTPATVRASAGAAEHVLVAQVTNLVRAMEWLKEKGIWIVGLETLPEIPLHSQQDLRGSLGLVIGHEGKGLSRLARETCDFLIRLPMHGQVQSLNAATAGAVALYEALRQRE